MNLVNKCLGTRDTSPKDGRYKAFDETVQEYDDVSDTMK